MRCAIASYCLVVVLAVVAPVAAQTAPLPPAAVPPQNVFLPNYNSVAIGEIGSLEANAFIARADDSSAVWFNPAGLALAKQTSVSGSAGLFQYSSVSPEDMQKAGSSLDWVPAMASLVVKDLFGYQNWSGGLAVTTVNAWSQTVDAERNFVVGPTNERVMYSSTAEMKGWMVDVGAGYSTGGRWRAGATLDGQVTTTRQNVALSDQFQMVTGLNAVNLQAHGDAWFLHLRFTGGVQFDVTPEVRIGAVMRTPGFKVSSGWSYNHEGTQEIAGVTTTASFFEPGSNLDYRLPFEFKIGGAYNGKRARFEVDVLTYQGTGAYAAMQTPAQWNILVDQNNGTAAAVQQLPITAPIIDSRSVVNIAVGGQYDLTPDGTWRVHGGWATDGSPVGANDTYFMKVDMQAFTAGVSVRKGKLLASGGFRYETGTSDTIPLRPLQDGLTLSTRMSVSNFGVVYSVALMF